MTRFRARFSVFFGAAGVVLGCSGEGGPEPFHEDELGPSTTSGASLSLGGNPLVGAALFFNEFPGTEGNGRACATCHVAGDAFQLTPEHVESRWQALAARRRRHPGADDPLFRPIDADDFDQDFTLLRTHALVRVVIPLPTDEAGTKLVWPVDDPGASSVEVFRATPTILNAALTAPYQSDGRFATLEAQASGALHAHAEIQRDPATRFLRDVSAFERTQFSSARVGRLAAALDRGSPAPSTEPKLDAVELRGKAIFERACATCHGGPRLMEPVAELASIAGIRDVFISKPLPPFAADLPFAESPVKDRLRVWAVRVPGKDPVLRESTDPGRVLQTGKVADFNTFDIPSLFGVAKTAPYFRDNSAATLTDVVRHYQLVAEAIRRVVPPQAPFPVRPDPIADEDFEPLVAYLERL